jgi:CubicO group peptidase (beta-lactamase class C family)
MARFGYLYLNKGMWDGEQVIPSSWIEDSVKSQIKAKEPQDYGYLFWIEEITDTVNNRTYSMYQAYGSGGQIIIVIPELDMVIVITCNRAISPTVKPMTRVIITDYILPSAYMD